MLGMEVRPWLGAPATGRAALADPEMDQARSRSEPLPGVLLSLAPRYPRTHRLQILNQIPPTP